MGAKKKKDPPRKIIRKLRHWKQHFDINAAFICRKVMVWEDETYQPGDIIPEGLLADKGKLRRFWEAQWIELAEFEEPDVATGQVEVRTDDDDDDDDDNDDDWLK
jgi:hypothetical protein